MNLAIIIGVEKYESSNYDNLPACKNDANIIKDIIENVKEMEEVLFFNGSESSRTIKRGIADFVEKYKGKEIDELLFYFTGHGERDIQEKERDINDFFYLLNDFDISRKRTTSLSNSELDDWVKTLSPKLFVKIVDACFSGTQYIKSENYDNLNFIKSAKKHGLNDIHFWFSSRENQKSLADKNLSKFTESILIAISELQGETRYREIKDLVADDFDTKQIAKPYFIDQSSNIEKFGNITTKTHELINKVFGIDENMNSDKKNEKTLSIFEKAIEKSEKVCFSEEELLNFIKKFNKDMSHWDDDISKIYDINVMIDNLVDIPNDSEIGKWLHTHKSLNYFAKPKYREKIYEVQEYIELPKKPKNLKGIAGSIAGLGINNLMESSIYGRKEDIEYKLETVKKKKQYIHGFEYIHSIEDMVLKISFSPKINFFNALSLYILPIYSDRKLVIHISYEELNKYTWNEFSSPQCKNWKVLEVNLKEEKSAEKISKIIKNELKKWLEEIISNNLNTNSL